MKINIDRYTPELILLLLAWLTVFLRFVPVIPVALLTIAVMILRLKIVGIIYISLMHLSVFWGFMRNVGGGIPIPGVVWKLLAIVLLGYLLSKYKFKAPYFFKGLQWIMFVLAYFVISSLTTSGGDYATTKLIDTSLFALTSYVAFTVLFICAKPGENIVTAFYFIILGVLLLRIGSELSGVLPSGLTDFGFMRNASSLAAEDEFLVSYHHPPFLALHGFALLFVQGGKNEMKKDIVLFLLFVCVLVSLYAGARQSIIISVLFLLLWGFRFIIKERFFSGVIVSSVIAVVIIGILSIVLGDEGVLTTTVNEGYIEGGGRGPWLIQGVQLFLSNPLVGVGFGRYSIFGEFGQYPHNIVIELLCEVGIVGTLIFGGIIVYHLSKSKKYAGCYVFLLLAFLMRAMASGGLDTNIAVLTLSVATFSYLSKSFKQTIKKR